MSIKVLHSNGDFFLTLGDQQINRVDSPLALIGRGAVDYAPAMTQNFVNLLENFANPTAPTPAQIGQLWFDSANNTMKVFDVNRSWKKAIGITSLQVSGRNGISITGSPVTTEGALTISLDSTGVREGFYSAPTMTINAQGRILTIADGLTSLTGAVPAIFMRSRTRIWKIEINDEGEFIKTPMT